MPARQLLARLHFLMSESCPQRRLVPAPIADNGLVGDLRLRGNGSLPELGPDVAKLTLTVENISPFILRTKIGAPGRWEVPRSLFNAPNLTGAAAMDSVPAYVHHYLKLQYAALLCSLCSELPADPWTASAASGGPASYTFNYSASPFSFAVSRGGSNADPVFNTAGTRLVFKVRRRQAPWNARSASPTDQEHAPPLQSSAVVSGAPRSSRVRCSCSLPLQLSWLPVPAGAVHRVLHGRRGLVRSVWPGGAHVLDGGRAAA